MFGPYIRHDKFSSEEATFLASCQGSHSREVFVSAAQQPWVDLECGLHGFFYPRLLYFAWVDQRNQPCCTNHTALLPLSCNTVLIVLSIAWTVCAV